MAALGAWVVQLASLAVMLALGELLLPAGNCRRMALLCLGLVIAASLLTPITQLGSFSFQLPEGELDTEPALKNQVAALVRGQTGFESATVDIDMEQGRIQSVRITYPGGEAAQRVQAEQVLRLLLQLPEGAVSFTVTQEEGTGS